MQSLAQKGYTRQQIMDILHGKHGNRRIKFRYDLLDKNENFKKTLPTVINATVGVKSLANIKRTAKFTIEEDSDIDYLNDRIQPFILFYTGKDWLEWSQGIYMLNSPTRKEQNQKVIREIEAYDTLQILADDKLRERMIITAGSDYYSEIFKLLTSANILKINISYTNKLLTTDREFETGTSKLNIINSLLKELNYYSIYTDENGYFTSRQYINPSDRNTEYNYNSSELSVIYNGLSEELDLFNIPNEFIAITNNPDEESFKSVYINDNPNSPLSTISRGRTITNEPIYLNNIADQQTLNDYIKRIAENANNVYGHLKFDTAIMPHHSFLDCLEVQYNALNISDKFIETSWKMKLENGAKMQHEVRKVAVI